MESSPESPRPPGSRKRWLRIALVSVGVLLLLVLVAAIALHTAPVRRHVLAQISDVLADRQIDLTAGALDYNLPRLSVTLRDIVIRSSSAPDLPPFARAARLHVRLDPFALLRGRYHVRDGALDDPDVHVVMTTDGRDNLPRLPEADEPSDGDPIEYLMESFAVRGARVRYEDRGQQIDLALRAPALDVRGDRLTRRHEVLLTPAEGTVLYQERQADLHVLSARLDAGPDDLAVSELLLESSIARLTLSGDVTNFERPDLDLSAALEVAIDAAAAFANLDEPVDGRARMEVTIRGPVDEVRVSGTLEGTDLAVRTVRDLQLSAIAAYDAGTRRAAIDDLRLTGPAGEVAGRGIVALDSAAGESEVEASISSLDVAALMRAADLEHVVASRMSGQLTASMPGLDYLATTGSSRLSFQSAGAPRLNVLPVGGDVTVEVRGPEVTARLSQVRALGVAADGTVTLTERERLSGTLTLSATDLAQAIAGAEGLLGDAPGTLVGTPVSGGATVRARLGGTTGAPVADLTLAAPSLAVGQASGLQVEGSLSYSPRAVDVHALDLRWQEAQAHVRGAVGLQGARPLALDVVAERLSIADILLALEETHIPASGVMSAAATIGGTLEAPEGQVSFRGEDLAAYGELLGLLSGDVVLQPGAPVRADVRLEKPQVEGPGVLVATGTYSLDDGRFEMDVSGDELQLTGLTLPGDVPVRGRLHLTGSAQGTLEDPHAAARVVAEDLTVQGEELGRITATADVAAGRAHVQLGAERFAAQAAADVALSEGYPGLFSLTIRDLDLAVLPVSPDVPLTGRLRATVDASGELAQPAAVTAVAIIEALDTSWNDQPIELDGPATLRYGGERIVVEHLALRARDSTIVVAGDLPLEESAEAGVVDIDARLDLSTLVAYAPADLGLAAGGTATLAGRIVGSLRAIDPTLALTLERGAIMAAGFEPGLTDVSVQVEVSEGELRVPRLSAALGAARVEATAHVPLAVLPEGLPVALPRADGEAGARAEISALDLATLPGAPDGLTGTLAVTADVGAARPELEALSGEIVFSALEVAFDGFAFAQQGISRLVVDQGTAGIEQMTLAGSAGRIDVRGRAGLAGEQLLDLAAEGRLELAALTALAGGVQGEGPVAIELVATGPLNAPSLNGFVELADARIVNLDPGIVLEELHARVDLSTDRAVLSRLDGMLNGGRLSGSGTIGFGEGSVSEVALGVEVSGMALDVPLELRSLIDADVRLTQQGDLFVVGGTVTIQEAGLTQNVALDRGLLAGLAGPRSLDLTTERNPLLERVRFDLLVTTATPILLDNNLARGEVTADLRVLGTPYEPGMSGRLIVEEDSTVTLNERIYIVERGIITFVEERQIVPVFDLQMTTRAGRYDILLAVTGPPGDTETVLTSPSNPELPEPDILALLVTGRTLDEVRGEDVARTQVLSYVSGLAGGSLGRGLERATGLSRVRLEPNLIAGEADPGARLTIGQDITDALRLIYSTDLVNAGDEIWVAEYDVTRRFQTRAVRQSDASYRFDMRHDVRFGGRSEPRREESRARQIVGEVRLEGEPGLEASEVLRHFDQRPGRTYSFFDVRRGVERVEALYRREGLLQSRIRARRIEEGDRVHLTLAVAPGPRVDVRYEGVMPPRRVQEQVALVWHRGVFDAQRTNDAEKALREWLVGRDHVGARLGHRIEELAPGDRRVTFEIDEGPRYPHIDLAFEGAAGIPPSELEDIVNEQRLRSALFTDPARVTELLERYYREQGYLSARIAPPQREFAGETARVILPVQEGPRFVIREVETTGNQVLSSPFLLGETPIRAGDPYLPAVAERSIARIRELYGNLGYNEASATYVLGVDRESGVIDVTIAIDEGPLERVVAIEVEGHEQTSARLVERQLAVQAGEPLAIASLGQSRRRLYDTRAFALVDILREEVAPPEAAPAAEGGLVAVADGFQPGLVSPADEKPVRLRVAVREVQPFQIRYGGFYDTERGPGGIADFSVHNLLGQARKAGLRTRYDAQLREGRLYLSQPSLAELPLETTANLFYVQERHPVTLDVDPFNIDRMGFSLQQEARLRASYVLNYGYRFERQRAYDRDQPRLRDETTRVSPVTGALTRDTRDDVLDAARGQFMAHAFSVSPALLGADRPFLKYFGQFFTYRPLEPERRERFTGEILRPRFVYAAGIRLGLARGIGSGQVPVAERFVAGGSTTLRGFGQHAVGPVDADGFPGGEATIVLNNEIRFPLISRFDGVAFLDVGNVFARVSDISLGLRSSGGVGLRVRTPWFLGRIDYGIPFDRRAGEAASQLFFSIGQAF